jgi:pimeloyl-ACP methyl ester carboxylesterase
MRATTDLPHIDFVLGDPADGSVLVIRGAESDALCDEQAARFASSLPAGRWAKVENAGHTVQGDNPRGLARVLVDFLAEIGH